MKGIIFMFGLIGIMMMSKNGQNDVTQLRLVTAQFQRLEAAQAAGYDLVSGPNQCLKNSAFGGLGYRYINSCLNVRKMDFLQPEVLVYIPGPNVALQFVALVIVVPVPAW